jgi:hypothetical protein
MTAPITLPPLNEQTLTELRRRYHDTSDAETRTRYQMFLLSAKGQTSTQIAQVVLRSQDTVVRVLKRFLDGRIGCRPLANVARSRANGDGRLGSRVGASHRVGSP